MTPDGGFEEGHEPPSPEREAVLRARQPRELVAPYPKHVIPLPTPGRIRAQVRTRVNRFYLDYHSESYGGGQGDRSLQDGQDGHDGGGQR